MELNILWVIQKAMKDYYADPKLINEITVEQYIATAVEEHIKPFIKKATEQK